MSASEDLGTLRFRCNICGGICQAHMSLLSREQPSCPHCESTVRMRAMIHALSEALFGESLVLPEFPQRPDLKGFGMSDWDGYAKPLAEKLGYVNTFYHKEPRLDITNVAQEFIGSLDFLISTDVFEHVAPPVSQAFINARKLLKDNGVFIFSVPYKLQGETSEHFPELHDYRIETKNNTPVLINITSDGRRQEYRDLVFHGGPGDTLEMRVFSQNSLRQEFLQAGFAKIEIYATYCFEYGIYWPYFSGVPMVAYASAMPKPVRKDSAPPFSIEAWGPHETLLNQGFNIQVNGASALWIRGRNLQQIRSFKFGDKPINKLTIARAGQVLTIELPSHWLSQVGEYPVLAVTTSGAEYTLGIFHVRPENG